MAGEPNRFCLGHSSRRKKESAYARTSKRGLGTTLVHVAIAAKALGKPLPQGAVVHHVNDDKRDNRNTNLVICQDDVYHRLLHARARVIRAGGLPSTHKICGGCKQCLTIDRFGRQASRYDGLAPRCRECFNAYHIHYYYTKRK